MNITRIKISQPVPQSTDATRATAASQTLLPHASQYTLRGSLPNTQLSISIISTVLGGLATSSLALGLLPVFRAVGASHWQWARPQLGVYGAAMGIFHLLEFWTTAGWNPQKLSVDGELSCHRTQEKSLTSSSISAQ